MKRLALVFAVVSMFGVFALADEGHHHEDLTAEQLGDCALPGFLHRILAEGI